MKEICQRLFGRKKGGNWPEDVVWKKGGDWSEDSVKIKEEVRERLAGRRKKG